MAPVWYLILILLIVSLGYPFLKDVLDVIREGLLNDLDSVPASVKSFGLLAMLLTAVIGIVRVVRDREK